jgi:hypothetical protein
MKKPRKTPKKLGLPNCTSDTIALAIASARAAGYRKGKDEADRALTTAHDNEINKLRNHVAAIESETMALMDREQVKGMVDLITTNGTSPDIQRWVMSVAMVNAMARELTRAYDKEKQA